MWESTRERWYAFTIEQKFSVVILGLCGIFAIGLSLYRIRENVRAPFLVDKGQIVATKKLVGPSTDEEQARLKRLDTDGDGLSDWDEANLYHTNPNLRDSCGDGTPDNIRVVTGKNLNCSGQQLNGSGFIDLTQVMSGSSTTDLPQEKSFEPSLPGLDMKGLLQAASDASTTDVGAPAPAPTEVNQVLARDPVLIRAALKGKIDDEKLQQISDEDLLKVYDEAAGQFIQQQPTPSSPVSSPTQP